MYNYFNAVREDVENYVDENKSYYQDYFDEEDWDGLEEKLNDDLWVEDSVTGNASGSYTFNRYQAEENLCDNWEDIDAAYKEFGGTPDYNNPEAIDVSIRCYYLGQAISDYINSVRS